MEHLTLPGTRPRKSSRIFHCTETHCTLRWNKTKDMVVERILQVEETECVKPQRDGNKPFLLQKYWGARSLFVERGKSGPREAWKTIGFCSIWRIFTFMLKVTGSHQNSNQEGRLMIGNFVYCPGISYFPLCNYFLKNKNYTWISKYQGYNMAIVTDIDQWNVKLIQQSPKLFQHYWNSHLFHNAFILLLIFYLDLWINSFSDTLLPQAKNNVYLN